MIRRGSYATCRLGHHGEKGFRSSIPVKVFDIKLKGIGVKQHREYWFKVQGMCVVGCAVAPVKSKTNNSVDLYCPKDRWVGTAGQAPVKKGVVTESDGLAYLGYYE